MDVRFLDSEFFSARLEASVNELLSVLIIEFFSARLPLRLIESDSVLSMEFFSPGLNARANALRGLSVQFAATPAWSVHEIGVVLDACVEVNIIFIVNTRELRRVRKREFFSVRLDAMIRAALSDLNIEFFSAGLVAKIIESVRPLNRPLVSDPAAVKEPLRL